MNISRHYTWKMLQRFLRDLVFPQKENWLFKEAWKYGGVVTNGNPSVIILASCCHKGMKFSWNIHGCKDLLETRLGMVNDGSLIKYADVQIDPELSRTVIVSTKLDTKIPQFARSSDVEVFLSPPACTLDGFILGESPFFTSVPSGRVGPGHGSMYQSNNEFKRVYLAY